MQNFYSSVAALLVVLGALSCGTPCSRIAAGEEAALAKGKACGTFDITWTKSRVESCESTLSKCSQDDLKWYDTYADCLQKLPVCAEGQFVSWNTQRLGCFESLGRVSLACNIR